MTFEELGRKLRTIMDRGVHDPIPDPEFNELALEVFRFQCVANRAYGAFVARRGVDPGGVRSWKEIPFLPTRAFKSMPLVAGDPEDAEAVFRTSGTTMGSGTRGEHYVLDLAVYRRSLMGNFSEHVLVGMSGEVRVLCLLPPPELAPDSSLSFMMGEVVRTMASGDSGFFVKQDGGIDEPAFHGALLEAEGNGEEVLLAGTAFSFVRWLETAEETSRQVRLPPGSRIMETGGYKGRSREVPRGELYLGLEGAFGIEESHVVNEYGMTELLSQFYEPVLGLGGDQEPVALADRYHRGPPWVRTLSLDPMTLAEVPLGEGGVLAHMDLANLGSVAAVLTEDLGRLVQGGFQLRGRNPGSEPRGCSLAMEDFLASRESIP